MQDWTGLELVTIHTNKAGYHGPGSGFRPLRRLILKWTVCQASRQPAGKVIQLWSRLQAIYMTQSKREGKALTPFHSYPRW